MRREGQKSLENLELNSGFWMTEEYVRKEKLLES